MSSQGGDRSLEQTPTWAVAVVCFVLVAISIVIEHIIHLIGMWLTKKNKKGLFEALEKIKSELMLMGFISLLLTVGQGPISEICIPEAIGDTWTPCDLKDREIEAEMADKDGKTRRRLLDAFSDSDSDSGWSIDHRRVLTDAKYNKCAQGKVPFVSTYGIHQLHIFIFVLAISHILYCVITLALGRAKMRKWKSWEMETRTTEYQFSHDPERFRFARETSFGRRHLNFWSQSPILLWIVCFFRQFVRSVPEVDYLTLRHGFIIAHLAPQSQENFDFHKYIKRSLEEDTKVVVGINPIIWFCAILFLLFNTNGWYSYYWLPFIPLIIILLVGTKLQVVITKMGLRIEDRGEVVRGVPLVQPGDDLFWFNRPHLLLYLIHFVLFQNAFQIAFFIWSWYEFGLISCFHEKVEDIVIRLSMGVLIQILCSYVTLPLYALVTQMGSNMKPTIFNERVAKALYNWHQTAKKHIKQNRQSGAVTPLASRPSTPPLPLHGTTPLHGLSPVHLLRHYRSELDTSPRISNFDKEFWEREGSVSPSPRNEDEQWSPKSRVEDENEAQEPSSTLSAAPQALHVQHTLDMIHSTDFSFDKRSRF